VLFIKLSLIMSTKTHIVIFYEKRDKSLLMIFIKLPLYDKNHKDIEFMMRN